MYCYEASTFCMPTEESPTARRMVRLPDHPDSQREVGKNILNAVYYIFHMYCYEASTFSMPTGQSPTARRMVRLTDHRNSQREV